jgi:hypothetical protein
MSETSFGVGAGTPAEPEEQVVDVGGGCWFAGFRLCARPDLARRGAAPRSCLQRRGSREAETRRTDLDVPDAVLARELEQARHRRARDADAVDDLPLRRVVLVIKAPAVSIGA